MMLRAGARRPQAPLLAKEQAARAAAVIQLPGQNRPLSRPSGKEQAARAAAVIRLALAAVAIALLAAYLWSATTLFHGRVQHQIEATGHSFVLSDLFPRWYGARALLQGQNPYSAAFTEELQRAYYGAPIDPAREIALFDSRLGFFYPPYVVLPLLPFLWLPFEVVRWVATILLAAALIASATLWWRALGEWPAPGAGGTGKPRSLAALHRSSPARRPTHLARRGTPVAAVAVFSLLFLPSLDLLWLQQLTGLVLLYLVLAHLAAARKRLLFAGGLLALAMIKPQAAAVPAVGLLFWAAWRRERWPLAAGFVAVMAIQLAVAACLLPGWPSQLLAELRRYSAGNVGLYWLPALVAGSTIAGLALVATPVLALLAWCWWRQREAPADSPALLHTAALSFAAGTALLPADSSLYNKVLLLVPLVTLAAAGLGTGLVGRITAQLVMAMVAVPVLALAVPAWLEWLHLGVEAAPLIAGPVGRLLAAAPTVLLPLPLIPALAALCFERPPGHGCSMATQTTRE